MNYKNNAQKIGGCSLSIVLETNHPMEGDTYHVAVRFTINRRSWMYRLGDVCTSEEFERIMATSSNRGRPTEQVKTRVRIRERWEAFLDECKARVSIMARRKALTLDAIKANFTGKSVGKSFIGVWLDIIFARQGNTQASYLHAMKSFTKLTGFTVKDGFTVTSDTLHKWVQRMTDEGKSKTTIGIYLRVCRVVYRECMRLGYISEADYPFSQKSDKAHDNSVAIPKGANRKHQHLSVERMTELYHFFLDKREGEIGVRYDYQIPLIHESLGVFLFLYMGNGMNLADMARLTYDDYYYMTGGRAFRFFRTKTKDRTDNNSEVIVPIIEPMKKILDEIAAPPERGGRVFPKILEGCPATPQHIAKRVALWNGQMLDRIRMITARLGWVETPSATWARHSFATNLAHAGVPERYISDSMGHSVSGSVTARYIDIFPLSKQMEYNNLLIIDNEHTDTDSLTEKIKGLSKEEKAKILEALLL